ncbi:MAG: glycogen debranching protein GlgX [Nitrospirota bacterium]
MKILPGVPYPLGASWTGFGVNFALFSENAQRVELCLFDPGAGMETKRILVREHVDQVWHVFITGIRPGQLYGYRLDGDYDPISGLRFNASKLLLDPYAKAIAGTIQWNDSLYGYTIGQEDGDLSKNDNDSAEHLPKCVIVDTNYDWHGDSLLRIPWHKTIIYELHVKGFTARHPDIQPELRGTYAGLSSPPAIEYLSSLGITAVELMPVHHFVADRHLVDRHLTNYWGYNSIGYFAPDSRYSSSGSSGQQVSEFKDMVRAFHNAGIEVILDVVYNHTAEGNQLGPSLCFRGIDNQNYYRLMEDNQRYYMDYTGTGNTLNMVHPKVLQLIMDSLRYWVLEMHVDGFRFDLASALARELHEVDRLGAFFDIIHQDPVLSQVKLIAEPWDLGEGGYQVGNFPLLWAEWNGRYRDTVRRFWRGDKGQVSDMAYRLTGSSDLYEHGGRRPYASINFVTTHDGFTLHDLVSYNEKHNEANGDENRDGIDENLSWNCGAEGPTDDSDILKLRERQKRNFLVTLVLSNGVPMMLGGDEIGRTQHGNNNAYCQDNESTWTDWNLDQTKRELLDFTRSVIQIFRKHQVFQRRHFFQGRKISGSEVKDLTWLRPDGREMQDQDWSNQETQCFGIRLAGDAIDEVDEQGNRIIDDTLLVLFNGNQEPVTFLLPHNHQNQAWELLIDTRESAAPKKVFPAGGEYTMEARSLSLLLLPQKKDISKNYSSFLRLYSSYVGISS